MLNVCLTIIVHLLKFSEGTCHINYFFSPKRWYFTSKWCQNEI